jgi:hypothetical protein
MGAECSIDEQCCSGAQCNGDECDECFPGNAWITDDQGLPVQFDQLQVGTQIQTPDGYSPVYNFMHREREAMGEFLRLSTSQGYLDISDMHYVEVNGELVAAKEANIGDSLTNAAGQFVRIVNITKFTARGIYSPYTGTKTLMVNGFKVCEFNAPYPIHLVQYAMWPLRFLPETKEGVAFYCRMLEGIDEFITWLAPSLKPFMRQVKQESAKAMARFDI